ncbi:MAG TPA: TMEM165/GDT1 family protein [Bacillota bacterium]|nr:TMEM165/GDT1 family protein [Bacillota bacterium]HOL10405.1 TMEM165/GDT1 family protein [Bacillota bacterium]HPO96780.1 TMEM165/GDT1 family protein [Bacillota bacterium]
MIQEMIRAFLLIFIAEMGDKTQILAMAFATKFPIKKVLLGMGVGILLNHGLAVALGSYLSRMVPLGTIQIIAGVAFVGFALWTLKPDGAEEDEEPKMQLGPIATVALAFFLGELGDKTQLTAITLATDARFPLLVLAGTVSAMIATGTLGIIVGKKLGGKIPELGIKFLAASIFMFFGLQKLSQTIPARFLRVNIVLPCLIILALALFYMVRSLIIQRRAGVQSALVTRAKLLHDYYLHLKEDLDTICLDCSVCQGNRCAVGGSKEIVRSALADQAWQEQSTVANYEKKPFAEEKVVDCLVDTLWLLGTIQDEKSLTNAHLIKDQMETILLGQPLSKFENVESYLSQVREVNAGLAAKIEARVKGTVL